MLKRSLATVSFLLLLVNAVHGQGGVNRAGASITGSIVLPTNQPMERYDILLLSKDGEQEIAHTYTDLSGRYRFANVPADVFDVVVRIEGFEEARVQVRLSPNTALITNIMLTPKATTVVVDGPWDSSVVSIGELTRKYSKKIVDDFQKAVESRRKGETAKAMELLEGVVKAAPDFYDAHNLLGAIYQRMERYRDAEKQYNKSRSLSPQSLAPLVSLATLYLEEAEANAKEGPFVTGVMYDDALHILQNAVRIDARNATVYYLLGVTFYRSHSYRYAEASFDEALGIDAHMSPVRLALANVYIRQQRWKEALDQFDMYLAENPKAADRSQVEAIRMKVIQQL